MVELETPKKKKLQEQMDVQMARQLEEEMARDIQRMNEQIAKDAEIARIHAEEELQMLIDGLDRNNETIDKYLQEYKQFAVDLSIGERIELINDLVKYQDNYAKVLKMSLEEIREKFVPVWKQNEDFIPIGSKEKGERFKRKGLRLEHDSAKKVKTSEEVSEEDLKTMMQLVPVEEVYVEALQVKHPIIDWEIHTEWERSYWKIIRLGGSSASYQFFVDMLKHFNREDLNQLWALVKETLNIRQATIQDKEVIEGILSSDEFPLPEDFFTAREGRFPLLRKRDATAKEVCTANKDKELIIEDGPRCGLHLNVDKIDVFSLRKTLRAGLKVFPPNISRSLHCVKLLGGPASVDFGFSSELVIKRVAKPIGLMDIVARINDPQCDLLLLHACTGISKLYFAMSTVSLKI
nr:hypothetical protein [Tanacetum cinerariifolium]